MKSLIITFVSFYFLLSIKGQSDSVFYYSPDGSKNYWYIQEDVFCFRCTNGATYTNGLNNTIVDTCEYYTGSVRNHNYNVIYYSKNDLGIYFDSAFEPNSSFNLYDISGRIIDIPIEMSKASLKVNLTELPSGIYVLNLVNRKTNVSVKIIKQ